jgi:hypothetical protein
MTTAHRIATTALLVLSLAATGVPPASARPGSAAHHPRALYSRQDKSLVAPNDPPAAVVQVQAPNSGFDWSDAGIGAAGGFALSMIAIGGALVVSPRRTRHSDTARPADTPPIMGDTANTATPVRSIARRLRRAIAIGVSALSAAVAVTVILLILAPTGTSRPTTRSQPPRHTVAHAPRPSRLDAADWITVQNVVRLRTMALAPGRTALYRSFAAYMGLGALLSLHPVRPGRCATAVSYLYDNLLDLHDAYPGEDRRPLRRLIRKQPSLNVCAPKATPHVTYG